MTPFSSVLAGIRTVNRASRLWVVYWLWNLVFALVVVLPLSVVLFRDLGHSLYAGRLFPNFELQYLSEMMTQTRAWPLITLAPAMALVAAGYALASVFLSGGTLWLYRDPLPRYMPSVFYQGCGRHFGRLVWLLALSLPAYAIALIPSALLSAGAKKIWGEGIEAGPLAISSWFGAAVAVMLLLAVNLVFDYARIHMVVEDVRNPFRAALEGWRRVVRNPGRTAGTYALVCLILVAFTLAYRAGSGLLPRTAPFWLAAAFLWQQVYVVARIWTRLVFYASQTRVYESLPAPCEPPAPIPEPGPEAAQTEPPAEPEAAGVESAAEAQPPEASPAPPEPPES